MSKPRLSLTASQDSSETMEQYIRSRDKFTFIIGVANVIFTPYFLEACPTYFPIWFLIKSWSLLAMRIYLYFKQNKAFFILDFCYFTNICILAYMHLFSTSASFFVTCWGFANGPLLLAIWAWRNSMVFHSLDKITSVFIHLSPSLLMYGLRWKWHGAYALPETMSLADVMYYGLIPYFVWQAVYIFIGASLDLICYSWIVFVVYKNDVPTSQKFLIYSKGGLPATLAKIPFGEKNAIYGLMVVQLGYTIVFLLPVHLMYQYQWFHLAVIILMGLCSISNGADFYFQIFLERYSAETKKLAAAKIENYQKGTSQRKAEIFGIQLTRQLMIGLTLAMVVGAWGFLTIV